MHVPLHPPHYCAYVLRCWEEHSQHPERPGHWRFSLEEINSSTRHGFATLHALIAFLQAELPGNRDAAAPGPTLVARDSSIEDS
jgi:hypothetical protein